MSQELIFKEYKEKDTRYFYQDKEFNPDGMDYKHYIKLRYNTINYNYIKDIYTAQGWYLLWHMMIKAEQSKYLSHTTINCISEYTKIKNKEVKDLLIHLDKVKIIKLSKHKNITYNTPLEIYIMYNDDNYYTEILEQIDKFPRLKQSVGYNPIPIDYLRAVLHSVNCDQWACLSVLLTKYSYYSYKVESDGYEDMTKVYHINHYAFPTIRQIEEYTGITRGTLERSIEKLQDNKYNLINCQNKDSYVMKKDVNGNMQPSKTNNTYRIELFERVEYTYYQIYKVEEKEKINPQLQKDLNRRPFKDVVMEYDNWDINRQDYVKSEFKELMKQYDKCIKDKDRDKYKELREQKIYQVNEGKIVFLF